MTIPRAAYLIAAALILAMVLAVLALHGITGQWIAW